MNYMIENMKLEDAIEISKWKYDEPYSIYSMDGSQECIYELLSGVYYSVLDNDKQIVGYFCYGDAATVPAGRPYGVYNDNEATDIGLGLRPDLCGKGLGGGFMKAGMEYAMNNLSANRFRLTVAILNKRAIRVYERLGFMKIGSFLRKSEIMDIEFDVMIKA